MVELRQITKDNYFEIIKLNVSENQKSFVATNTQSLAQAWVFYNSAYPFAIYSDNIPVGFLMLGYHEEKNIYDIWRLMIDENHQCKGYGKAAMHLAIEYLKKEYNATEISLSFAPDNTVAESLYKSIGFEPTGEIDGGEVVMRLTFN